MIQVVKIGGNVIDNPEALEKFLSDFASIEGPKVLIHGGGKEATRLSGALGVQTNMIDGRRVTDGQTLEIVTMVYAGLINKRIVSKLQKFGCNALGLSGADGNVITATRRPTNPIDFGFVGDITPDGVNATFLIQIIKEGIVPVICAICHDGKGTLLNCNADSVAGTVAGNLSNKEATRLTFCFEKPGVMTDVVDNNSVIPLITSEMFSQLKEDGVVAAGMIPKLQNALQCAAEGVSEVRICSADSIRSNTGTIIRVK